jgi:hypothetical protein
MIWVILAALGVPLWLCAIGILMMLRNNRKLRKRPGDIPVRVLRPGKKRWARGHAIWVSDVFAWRMSPAGWTEDLILVRGVSDRQANDAEHKKLHHFAADPVIVSLAPIQGDAVLVAARPDARPSLLGPFSNGGALREPPVPVDESVTPTV